MTSEAEQTPQPDPAQEAPYIPDVSEEMVPQKMPPAPETPSAAANPMEPDENTTENQDVSESHQIQQEQPIDEKQKFDAWDDVQGEAQPIQQETDYDHIQPPVKKRFPIEKFGVKHPQFKQVDPEILKFYWDYIGKAALPQIKLNHAQFVSYFHYGTLFKQFYPMPNCFNIRIMVNKSEYLNMALPKDLVNFILHPLIEPLSILELGDDIIMNLLEVSLAPYLENFEKILGFHIAFEVSKEPIQNFEFFTQWVVQEAGSGQSCAVGIYGSKDNIKDFFDRIYLKAQINGKIKPTISLSVISAIKQFPIQKVKALKHGEIIIILTDRHLVNEPLAIIGQRLVVTTQIEGNKLNIQSDLKPMSEIAELNMNQGEAPPADQTPEQKSLADNVTASMTDMRVPVTFELARMDLPVASLSNLGQGQILDLNKQIDENVSIVVNGKVVALGEVVQVGRNFGVIIKEVV